MTWSDKWPAIGDYFARKGMRAAADRLSTSIRDLLSRGDPPVRVSSGEEAAYQHCHRDLDQLIDLLDHPNGQPRWNLIVAERLFADIGTSRDMYHIATCLKDAVNALSSFSDGWTAHMAVSKQNTIKNLAAPLTDSLISARDVTTDAHRAGRAAQMEHLKGPLTNRIVNALAKEFGLRGNNQPLEYDTGEGPDDFQTTLDYVSALARTLFKPSSVSATMAAEAMQRYLSYRASTEIADMTSDELTQWQQDAARKVSEGICGQEGVLRPESFLLKASKKVELGTMSFPDNAALQFDLLAYMHGKGDMQGPPMVLGAAGQDADGPYRIVTDGTMVWKVMVDANAEMSWAALKSATVKRATLADFCAVKHDLSDKSIPYKSLIDNLLARQAELDPDASMNDIPAAYSQL
ncbi:hypothetical protein [Bordetella sp. LUAb4]|uniref:hypothetical protein n=1 Tax=Bordetella sp. LUAb4 TaxID=2843195 RepID=UPI001E5F0824|nr:hypothetical protein [Bordetella sp. LUAb4]